MALNVSISEPSIGVSRISFTLNVKVYVPLNTNPLDPKFQVTKHTLLELQLSEVIDAPSALTTLLLFASISWIPLKKPLVVVALEFNVTVRPVRAILAELGVAVIVPKLSIVVFALPLVGPRPAPEIVTMPGEDGAGLRVNSEIRPRLYNSSCSLIIRKLSGCGDGRRIRVSEPKRVRARRSHIALGVATGEVLIIANIID